MTSSIKTTVAVVALLAVTACMPITPQGRAYWERVEDSSALWMTGPKAQQQLDQDIAGCVREVDELVELSALRQTTPPDTHSEYHRALKASGDLDYYDTPTRYGSHKVAHTDYHDFESCMRVRGWERTNFVRYQTAEQAQKNYKNTQSIREWGVPTEAAEKFKQERADAVRSDFVSVNK